MSVSCSFFWVVISPLDHLTSLKAHDCSCFPLAFHLFTLLINFRKNNHWPIFKFPNTSLTLQRISDVHALFKSAGIPEMLSSELLLIIKLLFITSHVRTIGFYKIKWRDVHKNGVNNVDMSILRALWQNGQTKTKTQNTKTRRTTRRNRHLVVTPTRLWYQQRLQHLIFVQVIYDNIK